jgi:hypothetical protein
MTGRRVQSFGEVVEPGDYYGPVRGYSGDKEACFFRPPNESARTGRLHHITFPPHTYRECPDGSLEVRASIGCVSSPGPGYDWHGYLDEGHQWREV